MKRIPIRVIDEATAALWKKETIDYLKGMKPIPLEMELELLNALRPSYKFKGHLLLEPMELHKDATYLRSGFAKLYVINPVSGKQQILYIWQAGEIIVLFELFRKRLQNERYFIEVMEDAEVVSISNDCMDLIYNAYPVAHQLTTDILSGKTERGRKHMEILSIELKSDRYLRFAELFPEWLCLFSNEDLCAFLAVSEPTLIRAKLDF